MWLIPPSISPVSSRASECSTKACEPPLNGSDTEPALRVCVSGIPTPRPFSWRGWQTRAWSRALFSAATCQTSTEAAGLEPWISSLRDRPVSHSVAPGGSGATATRERGATETGRSSTSAGSSERCAPPWSSSRTCQRSLLPDTFDLSEKNYRDWVTRSKARSLSVRRTLARATCGSGYSSSLTDEWQTPSGQQFQMRRQVGQTERAEELLPAQAANWPTPNVPNRGCEMDKSHRPESGGIDLQSAVLNWPSPRAEDSESCGNHPDATDSLTGATSLWGTPRAHDHKGGGENTPENGFLDRQAEVWATPAAHERAHSPREVHHGVQLANQVDQWQTPGQMDGGATSRSGKRKDELLLGGQCRSFSPPAEQIHAGEQSSTNGPTSRRRLNPAFDNWLMGNQWWWTRAEPISFAASETAVWRHRLRQRLSLCFGER